MDKLIITVTLIALGIKYQKKIVVILGSIMLALVALKALLLSLGLIE